MKTNKILIIVVIILSLLTVGLTGYIIFNNNEEETNNIPIDNNTQNTKITTEHVTLLTDKCINFEKDFDCTDSFSKTIDSKNFEIKSDNNSFKFYLEQKLIKTLNIGVGNSPFTMIEKVFKVDDIIVIIYHQGTDIRNRKVYAFDLLTSKVMLDTYSIDPKYSNMVVSSDDDFAYIKDSTLYVKGTRLTHGPCIEGFLSEDDIKSDEIVNGLYKFEYLNDDLIIKNEKYTSASTYLQENNVSFTCK